jgi:hypothetical protein
VVRRLGVLCGLMWLVSLGGCVQAATRFSTNPSGAQIYVNGELIGSTPCTFFYDRVPGRRYRVQIRKTGFVSYEFFVDPKLLTNALEEQYRFVIDPATTAADE